MCDALQITRATAPDKRLNIPDLFPSQTKEYIFLGLRRHGEWKYPYFFQKIYGRILIQCGKICFWSL